MKIELLIDNHIETTLEEVLETNENLSSRDKKSLKQIDVSETIYIGICEIKRVA